MGFNIFVTILCIFVMVTLVAFFSFLIMNIVNLKIKMINAGLHDDEIKAEKEKSNKKQNKTFYIIFKIVLPSLLCLIISIAFIFSLYVKVNEKEVGSNFSSVKVVKSESMSYSNEKNSYLKLNNLKNQFHMFDIILLEKMPKQEDLKMYDIIAYELNDVLIIHRIVGIQEVGGEKLYQLRGDANTYNDQQYVKYSQMRGIYTGKKIPFVGSVILFLQSPAGWICLILCAFVSILLPLINKKLLKTVNARLEIISKDDSINKQHNKNEIEQKIEQKTIKNKKTTKSFQKKEKKEKDD